MMTMMYDVLCILIHVKQMCNRYAFVYIRRIDRAETRELRIGAGWKFGVATYVRIK